MSFDENPYQSNQFSPQFTPGGEASAASRVKGPAIGMMVLAPLWIIGLVIDLGVRMFNLANDQVPNFGGPAANQDALYVGAIIGAVLALVCIVAQAFVFVGAYRMMKLESYRLAMTASIISVIPCASGCCLIGIPFGIWALVVLNDASVKAAFRT
jgi:hypothetical protein